MQIAETLEEEAPRYTHIGRVTKALVKAGAPEEAVRIAAAIGLTKWNRKLGVLIGIADAHSEKGDHQVALRAWQDALQATKTGSERFRVLMMITNAQMKAGDREAALTTLQQAMLTTKSMREEDDVAGLYPFTGFEVGEIAKARTSAKDIIGAIQLANTIKHNQIRGDALAGIATMQAESGDIKGAVRTTGMIRPPDMAQRHFHGLVGKTSALLAIMSVQAKSGDISGALPRPIRSARASRELSPWPP